MPRLQLALVVLSATFPAAVLGQNLVVVDWALNGPHAADTGMVGLLHDHLGNAQSVLPTVGDTTAGREWVPARADSLGRLDLTAALGREMGWSAVYAHTYVFSPSDRTVLLVLDSDDDIVARVNGQRVWVNHVARGLGVGADTVVIRLAGGWNSLLLEIVNRSGGFGLLGKLAPMVTGDSLSGLQTATIRPDDMRAHNLPQPTATVGPLNVAKPLTWKGGSLHGAAHSSVTAWGPDTLRNVRVTLGGDGAQWASATFAELAPGQSADLALDIGFGRLRAASVGSDPAITRVTWSGGSSGARAAVDPALLLRLVGGRIRVGSWVTDSLPDSLVQLRADLGVPDVFAGLSLDLLTEGMGAAAIYRVNGEVRDWTDGSISLCDSCDPGAPLQIQITSFPGRPIWRYPLVQVRQIGYAEFADGFDYARALTGSSPDIEHPDPREWLAALGEEGGAAYRSLIDRYGAAYEPLARVIRRDTLQLIGNSHIDAAWLWRWSETIEVIRDTWRTSLKLAELFPGYLFAGSSAAFYDAMDRLEPALADSLAHAVKAGYWIPVGGWWVEADMNVPSGESLARQGLYGQRYFERRFGKRSRVAWTPDTFGYPWTLPQIMRLSGFEYFVTQKIRWNDSTEFPHNAFFWEGRDGTRIFTYNPYTYVHDLRPDRLVQQRLDDRERTGGHQQIVLYGVGDHGGGPTIEMLERGEDLKRVPTFPAMKYARPYDALAAVRREQPDSAFSVWRDEMYLEYHRGTYTSQAEVKRRNRISETKLKTAEALATFDTAAYPRDRLEDAWRRVLFNQFHDILPGSSIHQVYLDAALTYDTAWSTIDSVTDAALADLAARMDTRGTGTPAVVFNPLGWERSGTITVGGETAYVERVPSYGADVVWLDRPVQTGGRDADDALPAVGADWMENANLRIEIDTTTGEITRIFDKINKREAIAPNGRANVLLVFDDRPAQWDAWNIVLTGERWRVTDVRAHTPMRSEAGGGEAAARYRLERTWGNSTFTQTLLLSRDAPYLEIENDVSWHEQRKMLKAAFDLNVSADSATFEIPYGTIGRSGRPRTQAERAKFEVPGQRWADVSQRDYGVSLLNDSKYGWDYRGNVLRLTLLKSANWPDSVADRGDHHFRFAVYPHAGDWRSAQTVRRAAEYNTPLVAKREPSHRGTLGKRVSFAAAEPEGVELAWVKRAEDSDALVLRLVEWYGVPATAAVTLKCDVRSAHRANLLEDIGEVVTAERNRIRLPLRPYEIATVLVECR